MAKKGLAYHCPKKRVQIPADIRAIGGPGAIIANDIRTYWAKLASDASKHSGGKSTV